MITRLTKGSELTHLELDNNLLELEQLLQSDNRIGPDGDPGQNGCLGCTVSIYPPINPDTNPESKVWVQIDPDNNKVIRIFEYNNDNIGNEWNIPKSFKKIIIGNYAIWIINNKDEIWVAGADDYNELGTPPNVAGGNLKTLTRVFNNEAIKEIYSGYMRTFILKEDGTLWACGASWDGQLGLGEVIANAGFIITFTQVPITNVSRLFFKKEWGFYSTYLIKTDGTVWGAGYDYILGINGNQYNGVYNFTQIPNLLNPKEFHGNDDTMLVLNGDNKIYLAGWNYGQINNGISNIETFTVLDSSFDNPKLIAVASDRNAWFTFIQKSNGTVWAVGNNTSGQLGIGNTTDQANWVQMPTISNNCKKIILGYASTYIQAADNTLWVTGSNYSGQLGLGNTTNVNTWTQIPGITIKEIYGCQDDSIVIVKTDGTVWVCGNNYSGQLGLGDKINRTSFTQLPQFLNPNKIIADSEMIMIENYDGITYRAGYNGTGQLGNGSTADILTFIPYEI